MLVAHTQRTHGRKAAYEAWHAHVVVALETQLHLLRQEPGSNEVAATLDEGGGDVLREASGDGEPGCARGEFRWEAVDDVVGGAGIRTAGGL